MSDDISIPRVANGPGVSPARGSFTHSYRARRTGMDASTRLLFMAAAGLGLVLVAGMGVWSISGHRAAGVPVIEADTRPLRVKPDNPGGMTVVGTNDSVMGGHGDGAGEARDLAPEAERPDPQALLAQRQVATAAPMIATPAVTGGAVPSEAPVVSNVIPAVVRPAPSATVAPATVSPATGTTMVQIAAVDSEAMAMPEWTRLAHKAPELLGERKPNVVRTEKDGKTFWRLRTGGFVDAAAASEFCRKVRAKGLGCSITS
jgi:hypothetical protein